jgi:hypothetical protein
MVTVYFETNGYAEKVAVFDTEKTYLACLPALQKLAARQGFDKITETIN